MLGTVDPQTPSENTTAVVDKTATHQPAAAQALAEPNERQSHFSSSRESLQIPKAPFPRLAQPPVPHGDPKLPKFTYTAKQTEGIFQLRQNS
jgi:hypothetical protein